MRSFFRSAILLPVLPILFGLYPPCHASSIDERLPDAQTLIQLELRAQQASPRDQCFLYTELVHTMTELAGKQLRDGNFEQASSSLKKVNQYAQMIHMELGTDSKRLKNAEMLLEHTSHRLGDCLRQASFEDREPMQTTLKQLDRVHDELLAQVFSH